MALDNNDLRSLEIGTLQPLEEMQLAPDQLERTTSDHRPLHCAEHDRLPVRRYKDDKLSAARWKFA